MTEPQVRIGGDGPADSNSGENGNTNANLTIDVDADIDMDGQAHDDGSGNGGASLEFTANTLEADADAETEAAIAAAITASETKKEQTFLDFLKSPIVELGIGPEASQVTLSAHEALLLRSPFFADALSQFSPDVTLRRIEMSSANLDTVACMLQYLYTGEYYPRRVGNNRLEIDGTDDGEQLLKHARVYTLAGKLQLDELEKLALSKVHLVDSTTSGEIKYARYVYSTTAKTDTMIRKPIASFWGARSHVLRHDAEDDFKQLCIEFPEFAFDVLTNVLDYKERKSEKDRDSEVPKSARKRARQT